MPSHVPTSSDAVAAAAHYGRAALPAHIAKALADVEDTLLPRSPREPLSPSQQRRRKSHRAAVQDSARNASSHLQPVDATVGVPAARVPAFSADVAEAVYDAYNAGFEPHGDAHHGDTPSLAQDDDGAAAAAPVSDPVPSADLLERVEVLFFSRSTEEAAAGKVRDPATAAAIYDMAVRIAVRGAAARLLTIPTDVLRALVQLPRDPRANDDKAAGHIATISTARGPAAGHTVVLNDRQVAAVRAARAPPAVKANIEAEEDALFSGAGAPRLDSPSTPTERRTKGCRARHPTSTPPQMIVSPRAGPPDGSAASKAAACGGQPGGRPAWNAGPGARTPTMTPRKLAGVGAPPSAQLAVGGGSASPGATVETLAEARRRAACAENDARVLRRVAADLEDDNRRLRWEKARLQVLAMDSMRDGVEPVGRDTSFEPPLRTPPRAAARPPVTAEPTRASVTRSAARSPSAIAAQRGSTATTPRARDRTAASTAAAQLASPPAPSQRVAEE